MKMPDRYTVRKRVLILLAASAMLVALFVASLCIGAVPIPLSRLVMLILKGDTADRLGRIFFYVRLPRTLASVLCGAALSLSGTLLQALLRNPMCSPSVIGVNAGAGLFMIVVTAFLPSMAGLTSAASFAGAMFAVVVVYLIAKRTGGSKLSVVLSGIAVSSLFTALIDTVITLKPDAKISRVDFLIGSLAGVTMSDVAFAVPLMLIGLTITLLLSFDLNVLSLGDATAGSLGLRINLLRGVLLIAAAMLAGSAISIAGLIGFVGLIVPHICRTLIGHDHRFLLPLSAIVGGGFLAGCDLLSRVLFAPFELPVGIVMSLLGAPFFIWLLVNRKERSSFD